MLQILEADNFKTLNRFRMEYPGFEGIPKYITRKNRGAIWILYKN